MKILSLLHRIRGSLTWICDSLTKTYFALGVGVLIAGVSAAATIPLQQTPTGLAPGDISTLDAQITAAATSLTVNPVKKWLNGVRTTGCFHSGSGFLLIQDFLGRVEYASFNGKSCSASNITTLSNLRRGLSLTAPGFAAGTGLAFDAGATVRVIDYPLLYNNAVYRDIPREMIGSGALVGVGTTQPWLFPNSVTTAQRDNFTYGNDKFSIIWNSSLSLPQFKIPSGSWQSFGAFDDGRFVSVQGDTMTGALLLTLATGNSLVVDTSTFVVDATNNWVGIGTTAPGNALEVIGTISGSYLKALSGITTSGSLVIKGTMSGATAVYGAGLVNCTGATDQKLLWNSSTGKFSCGTDNATGTGLSQDNGDARYVQKQGGTMTGQLVVRNNISGSTLQLGGRLPQDRLKRMFHRTITISTSDLAAGGADTCDASSAFAMTGAYMGDTCVVGAPVTTVGVRYFCNVTATGSAKIQICIDSDAGTTAEQTNMRVTTFGF